MIDIDEQQVLDAFMTRANTALGGRVDAYEHDNFPGKKPDEYVIVTIARRAGGSPRAGRHSTTGWAVYVLAASHVSSDNARLSLHKVRAEFINTTLDIAGESSSTSTPITFRTARAVGAGSGWFSGVDTFHFTV